ncbi:ribbon-helix-helix domain-containing protein [Thermococcus thioreducens]|uniref:CopG family transcriptional regulator n=1 Tax=Thermococcus thioreducens TaxID=277988 RepID=A0A0Q2UP45_9EURY|nr:ribbon-helix-helix domain-containing protein [Thermococcus thioreducens]ASJ12527.1 CopG family transcriptional regulator [Thermococcus thioreducens]KQH82472.1 CopG family transcriptional regulator [Thermococcus thioreducens]SEV89338.1 Ribbon-helix-helix domain-containing protein [Thermococcus thioreducens]
MGRVKTSVYIDEELWGEFKELAHREKSEVSKLLEEALVNYLINEVLRDVDDSEVPLWFEPLKVGGESTEKLLREMRDDREKRLLGQ